MGGGDGPPGLRERRWDLPAGRRRCTCNSARNSGTTSKTSWKTTKRASNSGGGIARRNARRCGRPSQTRFASVCLRLRCAFLCRILVGQCEDSFSENLEPIQIPPELNEEEALEYELNYKNKIKGNMIFVGELLKSRLLSQRILIECIDRLLTDDGPSKEQGKDFGIHRVEAMCTFFRTVGPSFDTPNVRSLQARRGRPSQATASG